jgi:putative inorganic carbon (hco3(-)) transporter
VGLDDGLGHSAAHPHRDAHAAGATGRGALAAAAATAVWFCALNFQTVTVTGTIVTGNDGPAFKLYHAVFAAIGVVLVARDRIVRWRGEMTMYFAVVLLTTLVAYMHFGAQAVVVNSIFAAYAATIGATFGLVAGQERTIRALRATSVLVLAAVFLKAALHVPEIVAFLAAPNGHPTLPLFYGGGPNLEATWVAMAGVFFLGSRLFVPYVLASTVLSLLYASRVGIIIVVLILLGAGARSMLAGGPRAGRIGRGWIVAGAVVVAGVAAVRVASSEGGGVTYIVQRFQNIGDEPGSVGRLTLWEAGLAVFVRHPLGVGLGNSVPEGERLLGINVPEDNLHNQYLQHLAESGVQGFVAYVLFAGFAVYRLVASRFRDRMLLYVVIYFVVATIQFRGAEALLWFVYGLQHGSTSATGEPSHAS